VVHVQLLEAGGYEIDEVTLGDTVTDVLKYVDYSPSVLINRLRDNVEGALRRGQMTLEESKQLMERYREGLSSYTYLV
jgi:arginine decarboxylase